MRFLLYFIIFAAIVAAAIVFMPLRLAVDWAGLDDNQFTARQINGTIWDGRIVGAQLGPLPLGDLDAGMQFWPLVSGDLIFDIERPGDAPGKGMKATLGRAGNGLLIADANAAMQIGRQLAPLPASTLELTGVTAYFENRRCQSASGQVRISLDSNIPGLDLKQGLLGNAECQDGELVLPLVSGSGMEQLTLKLDGSGDYTARLFLSGGNAAWSLLLPRLGFSRVSDGYAIRVNGNLGQQVMQ